MRHELQSIMLRNLQARSRLREILADGLTQHARPAESLGLNGLPIDIVVTANEVNRRHGTGVLLQKIFGDSPNIVSIRSRNNYLGEHNLGAASFCLMEPESRRSNIFVKVANWLCGSNARHVICIPYHREDLSIAIAVKELFEIPLCIYIMDDNNLHGVDGIPDTLMAEALSKASLRIAISPEMQRAYETKYRLKFWILPPVVSPELISQSINVAQSHTCSEVSGVLVGNIWRQEWLERLLDTMRGTGAKVDWFCNSRSPGWLSFDENELLRAGITLRDPLPEADLVAAIRDRPFALMPSGVGDGTSGAEAIAAYSLPSRVPFIVATCNTPIIVLGKKASAVARFVTRFGVGTVCDYTRDAFRAAVEMVRKAEVQASMRRKAFEIGKHFSAAGIYDWIWESTERGRPIDDRYEALMPLLPGQFAYYLEPPVPTQVYEDFAPAFRALRRLTAVGYSPDFVIDIGSSTGAWSESISTLFPQAHFILIDPLASRYPEASKSKFDGNCASVEVVEAAMADRPGRMPIQVSADLYNSSLLHIDNISDHIETIEVQGITLDGFAQERRLSGRGLIKIDVQFAEHLIIGGGTQLLTEQIDVLIVELTLERVHSQSKTFLEMLNVLDGLGFRYADDVGSWRSPDNGRLQQKDGLFLHKDFEFGHRKHSGRNLEEPFLGGSA